MARNQGAVARRRTPVYVEDRAVPTMTKQGAEGDRPPSTHHEHAYTECIYDDKGNRTSVRDPRANSTALAYDPLDRLIGTTQPLNTLTDYGYDSHDNPTAAVDPNDLTTQYATDDFGNRYSLLSPDTGASGATFDPSGNILTRTDANGSTVSLSSDALNRPTSVELSDSSQNIGYTYDAGTYGIGRLTGRTDPSAIYTFSYDGRGNLTTEQNTISNVPYTTQYAYNGNNALTTLTYPSGRTVTYAYDAAGRISQVSTNGTTLASSLTYLPFGGITGLTYGNGLPLVKTYDTHYRLFSLTVGSILGLSYEYDPNNNITAIIDSVTPSGGPTDAAGVYTYATGTNRLSSAPGIAFSYDTNGNIASENTRAFTYDLLNRVKTVSASTQIAQYTYNALNQRIAKTTSSGTRIFHYDLAGHLIAETTTTGTTLVEYIYLDDTPLAQVRNGSIYYYHTDHLGTPQVMTNASGTIVWKADYTPFGKATVTVGTVENNIRFPGQYYDAETGLHYNWNRYYQPETGRHVTPDPIGLGGGVNPYVYVDANPVNSIDPWGLASSTVLPGSAGGLPIGHPVFLPGTKENQVFVNSFNPIVNYARDMLSPVTAYEGAIDLGRDLYNYFRKPPKDAADPNGPKAPGRPGKGEGFKCPKGRDNWVRNPNGRGWGWQDANGRVWVPTGLGGEAHGGPHWDVQNPATGGKVTVYPGGNTR
jgi:RHS repeat-associated protein